MFKTTPVESGIYGQGTISAQNYIPYQMALVIPFEQVNDLLVDPFSSDALHILGQGSP